MRIVHIITSLGIGGAERMVQRLVEAHQQIGDAESTVISLTSDGVIADELRAAGIAVETVGLRFSPSAAVGFFRLVRRLRALRPDIVQTWLYHADLVGGIAARLAGIKAVAWNLRGIAHGRSRITGWIVRLNARLSHVIPASVICCGHAVRDHHIMLGYDPAKMTVLPNGYDLVRFVPPAEPRSTVAPLVIALGRNDMLKDYPTLIRAMAAASDRLPQLRGVIYGRGCRDDADLTGLISSLGKQEVIALHDEIADVRQALDCATIFASSSVSEGFPNVIAEAMAMGVPCAVTQAGDSALIVGDCGNVVPASNWSALADAIVNIASLTPTDYRALAQRARQRIADNFEMGAVARSYFAHYQGLIQLSNHAEH
jgi:glycosyltransferase involved in cell wall biosynthesis